MHLLVPGASALTTAKEAQNSGSRPIGIWEDSKIAVLFNESRDGATIRCRRPLTARDRSGAVPPEEVEELVAAYLGGATALALAGKHSPFTGPPSWPS